MNNYVKHAIEEFRALGYTPVGEDQEDGPSKWIQENIIELLNVFGTQGHSGSSAPYCVQMFSKLALFEPIAPLTGEDWEWADKDHMDGTTVQNKRCSHVFKNLETGRAYDIKGKVFIDPDGCAFTSRDSRVDITFPYTPKTEYVKVEV